MAEAVTFDQFYVATRHRVVTFLYAMSGDLADAQDIAQEAYARAWQHWVTVRAYADPEAWVRTVGYRIFANAWRKGRNRLAAHRRHGAPAHADAPPDDAVVLISALRRLSPEQRVAIVLHHMLDLPVAEVAIQTGVPVNTVKARLARGRRILAKMIGPQLPEEVPHA